MQESSFAGDLFAWGFLIVLFAVLFGLPIWLAIRYSKKSKARLQQELQKQEQETPAQRLDRQKSHNRSVAGILSFVAGLLFGSRILNNRSLGLLIGLSLSVIAILIVERIYKNRRGA